MNNMIEWAKNEIRIVLEHEECSDDENDKIGYEYAKNCYASALKAYESLLADGHSGMSIGVTKGILNRLIDGKPLSPISDAEDEWEEDHLLDCISPCKRNYVTYNCKRMSSLYKNVHPDGRIRYFDCSRTLGVDVNNPDLTYRSSLTDMIVNKMYPITMPYCPTNTPYKVYTEDFTLFDRDNSDFNTVHIHYIKTPDGDKVDVNRVFTESIGEGGLWHGWKEITLNEFEELKRSNKEWMSND